jgi:hypothetical protein
LINIEQPSGSREWYEATMALPNESSSIVRAFKILRFPPNMKGEVTDQDFELLKQHGHIGEGRLQLVEDLHPHETDLADRGRLGREQD